jgi:energy-converting hydrogenase Eha subunit A
VQAAYWYLLCDLDVVLRPQSTEELAAAIKELHDESVATGVPVKVRATREAFHSSAAFPCPTAAAGTELAEKASTESGKKVKRVGVMMEGLAKMLEAYPDKYQLRLGAGELLLCCCC